MPVIEGKADFPGRTQTSEYDPKQTWAPQRKIEAVGLECIELAGALCFAPGNGKASAARATGPANADLGQIGLSRDYRSQVRNKVLGSALSQRRG